MKPPKHYVVVTIAVQISIAAQLSQSDRAAGWVNYG